NVTLTDLNDAVKDADIVLLLVDHTEFARIDRSLLAQKIVHDTRGVWN
ncbi:UDP binding domain-containing protein, partial [Brevibacterium casei]